MDMLKERAEEAESQAAAAEQLAAELARKNADLEAQIQQAFAEPEQESRCA